MKPYLDLLQYIYENGEDRPDRTKTGTRSIFGARMEIPVRVDAFPVVTTKKLYWRGVVTEILWFLRGDTNIKYLQDHGVHIWDEWADENGDLGPVYGKQWRNFGGIDQIKKIIADLTWNPFSRRHILSAWNVGEIDAMALPPCHMMAQCYVTERNELDCQLYQRSADMFLGVPFNIASYALLTTILADMTGLTPGRLIHVIGDAHVYHNHFRQVEEQLSRAPKKAPCLIRPNMPYSLEELVEFDPDVFSLEYEEPPHPTIKAPIAV